MNLLDRYRKNIESLKLFTKEDHLLIAVSGGVDSVVLCHLNKTAGLRFSIAHCNFGLRGEESERDKAFVKSLANELKVPFYCKEFDTNEYASHNKISVQVAARNLRYEWFNQILKGAYKPENDEMQKPFALPQIILTAHHADDNVETLLINFFKGTGLKGLQGIPLKNEKIVRPLLFASKLEILDWAHSNNIEWINDSSNEEIKYTRNYLRHQVIPALEKVFPQVKENLRDNLKRFSDIDLLYRESITLHKKKLLEYKDEEVHIPVLKLKKVAALQTILFEVIKEYGFNAAQVVEALKLLQSETGKYISSHSHRILRNRGWLIITPLNASKASIITIEAGKEEILFENGKLNIYEKKYEEKSFSKSNAEVLDAGNIEYPLILRKWKSGDYFYPLGMRKKKKIARFLIDQKISQTQKEKTWVLESGKKIVWVVGLRIDDRFKMTSATKKVIHFSLSSP